jgi:hypothetical protein
MLIGRQSSQPSRHRWMHDRSLAMTRAPMLDRRSTPAWRTIAG